jgi:glycerol-3-phosphate acyltransferase PlsY
VILIARLLFDGDSRYLEAIAGLTTLVGHAWPVYYGFRGGKGVTTGWAALLVMSPWAAVTTFSGLIVASTTRYISLGSIIGSGTAVVYLTIRVVVQGHDDEPILLYTGLGWLMVILRHRANIRRLLRGEESKFGARVEAPADVSADGASTQGE